MAAKRKGAGSLSERVVFQSPLAGEDGFGGVQNGWQDAFEEAARLMPLKGGEPTMASRLQGVQPYVCTIHSSARTRGITPAWRAKNKRTGVVYNITAVTNPDERNHMLDVLMTEGVSS